MKSEEYKNQLKGTLRQLINTIDDTYYSMRSELEDEILQQREKIEKINEETNQVYDKLTDELCIKLIKIKLPLRVRLFNKIEYCGRGVEGVGYISIYFNFNDNHNSFSYLFRTSEIKELLRIKDGV